MPEYKFRHGFKDTVNPLCFFSIEAETTTHYFLRCHYYNANRATFMSDFENILISFSTLSSEAVTLRCFAKKVFFEISQNSQETMMTKTMTKAIRKTIKVNYKIY